MIQQSIDKTFIWDEISKFASDKDGLVPLESKPVFSFLYDKIKFLWNEQLVTIGTDVTQLTEAQIKEIEEFITKRREIVGILATAVDAEGNFLGLINLSDPKVKERCTILPPTPNQPELWLWDFVSHQWNKKYFYDKEGIQVDYNNPTRVGFVTTPPPVKFSTTYLWNFSKNIWEMSSEAVVMLRKFMALEIITQTIKYNMEMIFLHDKNLIDSYINVVLSDFIESNKIVAEDPNIPDTIDTNNVRVSKIVDMIKDSTSNAIDIEKAINDNLKINITEVRGLLPTIDNIIASFKQ